MPASLQQLCQQKGLSLLELADRSRLDLVKTRAIFLGRWTPDPVERQAIAAALETSVEEVAWGHQTPIQHIYGHGPG